MHSLVESILSLIEDGTTLSIILTQGDPSMILDLLMRLQHFLFQLEFVFPKFRPPSLDYSGSVEYLVL